MSFFSRKRDAGYIDVAGNNIMNLKSQMAHHLYALFFDLDRFGEMIIYSTGASSMEIPAIIDYVVFPAEEGAGYIDVASVIIRASDVPNPAYGHTIAISGVVWHVQTSSELTGASGIWSLKCTKNFRSKLR